MNDVTEAMDALADLADQGDYFVVDLDDPIAFANTPSKSSTFRNWVPAKALLRQPPRERPNGYRLSEGKQALREIPQQVPTRDMMLLHRKEAIAYATSKGWI